MTSKLDNDHLSENEYIRIKLELAQTRARTDTARLEARGLINKRDTLREAVAASKEETEEQNLILAETMDSIEKLKAQISIAEMESTKLLARLEKNG